MERDISVLCTSEAQERVAAPPPERPSGWVDTGLYLEYGWSDTGAMPNFYGEFMIRRVMSSNVCHVISIMSIYDSIQHHQRLRPEQPSGDGDGDARNPYLNQQNPEILAHVVPVPRMMWVRRHDYILWG